MRYFHILAFGVACLAMSTAIAQKNFQPGTIVKTNGETQTGFIDYRNWRKNPRSISFKTASGQVSELSYKDLASFEVRRPDKKMERYKRAIVQVDVSPREVAKLDDKPLPIFKTDTLLLMVLVTGNMDLYHLVREDEGTHFFFGTSKSDEIIELVRKEYVPKNTKHINVNYQYRKQLLELVADCGKTSSKDFANLDYNMPQMVRIAQAINECLGGPPTYVFQAEKNKIEFFINGGVNAIGYDINSNWEAMGKADFNTYFGPTGGLGFNWMVPRTQGKLFLVGEANYYQQKSDGLFITPFAIFGYDHYVTKLEAQYIGAQVGLEWRIYDGKFTPFLKGAFAYGKILKASQSGVLETHYNDGRIVFRYDYTPYESLRKTQQGAMLGLGTILPGGHWRLEARMSTNNGLSTDPEDGDKLLSFALMAGYRF